MTTPTSPAGLRVLLEKFPGLFKTLERLEFVAGMAANQNALDYEVTFTPADAKLFAADVRALVNNAEQLIGAAERAEWRDIESAPRDGTWFLACATTRGWGATRIVRYAYPDDRLPIHGEGNLWPSPPTHWMPLPSPPQALGAQDAG